MANLVQLRVRVSSLLDQPLTAGDIPATGVYWTLSEVTAWINEGYRDLYAEIAGCEINTLLATGDVTYPASALSASLQTLLTLTEDPLRIEEVRDITGAADGRGVLMPYVPHRNQGPRVGRAGLSITSVTRRQFAWDWYGYEDMMLEVDPIPTSALSLRIRYVPAQPTELSVTTDIPSAIPPTHHDLLVMWAVIRAKQKEEDVSWRDDDRVYQARKEQFRMSIEERQGQSSRHVHITDPNEYQNTGPYR